MLLAATLEYMLDAGSRLLKREVSATSLELWVVRVPTRLGITLLFVVLSMKDMIYRANKVV